MTEIDPGHARAMWKALMDNASALIRDAGTLFHAGSFGRARSLTVLAQEELGKALWIYNTFQFAWSDGDSTPREVPNLEKHGRHHIEKYMEAYVYGDELAEFWGDFSRHQDVGSTEAEWAAHSRQQRSESRRAAKAANRAKQNGFYVDADSVTGEIVSPSSVDAGTIGDDLTTAAQVVEMLLIDDHVRMKHHSSTPYDSTHEQQFRLLPISHPDVWATATSANSHD